MNELWNEILKQLKVALSETAVSTWFSECEFVALEDDNLVICANSGFKKDVIEKRFGGLIKYAAKDLLGGEINLTVLADGEEAQDWLGRRRFSEISIPSMPEFTFGNFVVGESNRLPFGVSLKVSEEPDNRNYNPLFIYSDSGLGKTHLLFSIGQAVREKYPGMKVVYTKGVDFLNSMVEAISRGECGSFREEYRRADLLLIDDIHIIAGKRATQEEFFNTFNAVYEAGHQIVVTCDCPPKELSDLEHRLLTRFESGIIAQILPPELQLRKDIVSAKAGQAGLELSGTDIDYIAGNLDVSIRQLEGAVKSLAAYRDIMGKLTGDVLIRTVENMRKGVSRKITPEAIIEETAKYFSVSPDDIRGDSRVQRFTAARCMAMFLMREKLDMTYGDIGQACGNRNHATVINNCKQVFNNKSTPKVDEAIRSISMNLSNKAD